MGIIFRSLYAIVSRFYYAQKDTITPLLATILVLVSNVILSYWLANQFGVSGLGMATSIVAILEIAVLVSILWYRDRQLFHWQFFKELMMILLIGVAVAAVAVASAVWLPFRSHDPSSEFLFKLGVILGLTFAIHFILSHFLRVRESRYFWDYCYQILKQAWQGISRRI